MLLKTSKEKIVTCLFAFLCICLGIFMPFSAFSAFGAFGVCEIFSKKIKSLKLP